MRNLDMCYLLCVLTEVYQDCSSCFFQVRSGPLIIKESFKKNVGSGFLYWSFQKQSVQELDSSYRLLVYDFWIVQTSGINGNTVKWNSLCFIWANSLHWCIVKKFILLWHLKHNFRGFKMIFLKTSWYSSLCRLSKKHLMWSALSHRNTALELFLQYMNCMFVEIFLTWQLLTFVGFTVNIVRLGCWCQTTIK